MSRSRPTETPDLDRKWNFLISHELPRKLLGHSDTETSLCEALGLSRTTLRSQLVKGQLSAKYEAIIASRLAFDAEWPEWKIGSHDDFRSRYITEVGPQVLILRSRRTGVRLARGPRVDPTPSPIIGLAAIEMDGSQFGAGSVAIEITLSCGEPFVQNTPTTIKAGRIELLCNPGLLSRESLGKWTKEDLLVPGRRGEVQISFEAGTRSTPSWRVIAHGPSIGTIELDPSFAALEELAPGDKIEVRFGTWLSDLDDVDDHTNTLETVGISQPDSKLPSSSEALLSKKKQRIISCLRKGLVQSDANGYVVLATHTLNIVEAKL